jgi:hypothetical protein
VIAPTTLPNGTVGAAYSQTLTATGGVPPYKGSTTGTLPPGLMAAALGQSATISGTPTQAGTFTFTAIATDTLSNQGSRQYTVTIDAAPAMIVITPPTLPNGTVNTPYSQTITASGGSGPYIYAVTAGALPGGLSLNTGSGVISGTPTTAGASNFTIMATDSGNNTGTQSYTVSIAAAPAPPIVLSPTTLPGGTVGVAYSQRITVSGGVGPPYTGSITSGSLPPGLTGMAIAGTSATISGTPTEAGSFTFTGTATDAQNNVGSQAYSIVIQAAPAPVTIVVAPPSLPNGVVNVAYSQTITASGGTGSYTFSVSGGTLPGGLTLNSSTGALSGTPNAAGTSNFTINATDTANNTGSHPYALTVTATPTPPITLSPTTLPGGSVGAAYSQTVTALGGVGPPYTQTISAGTLPTGLTFTSGLLSGTPVAAGSFSFTVTATDASTNSGSQAYTVTISATVAPITIAPTTLPNGTVGVPYSQTLTATGGVPPYQGSTSGTLPPGLTAVLVPSVSAIVSGTPTQPGTFTFSVIATDTLSSQGSQAYTVTIAAAPVTIVVGPPSLPNGVVNVAYAQTITATGGTGPHTFAVTAGALPAGLTLNGATGGISGTPTGATTANFTITATDATKNTGSRAYALTITPTVAPPITVSPTTLPDGTVGAPYTQTVTALGGVGPPYTLSITAGTLPTGLTFTAGLLSGTPAIAGAYTFTVTAIDSASNPGSQAYTVTIQTGGTPVPPITVGPPSLPNGVVGQPVQVPVTASGGDGGPYTFAITAGALPPGLSMTTGGVISGTPTTTGPYSFTVTATDASGNSGTRTYTGVVSATPVPVLPWWVLAMLAYFAIRLAASRVRHRTT